MEAFRAGVGNHRRKADKSYLPQQLPCPGLVNRCIHAGRDLRPVTVKTLDRWAASSTVAIRLDEEFRRREQALVQDDQLRPAGHRRSEDSARSEPNCERSVLASVRYRR
jgi:hypothetical protein